MNWLGRTSAAALVVGTLTASTACMADKDSSPAVEGSGKNNGACARQFTYQGKTYSGLSNFEFTATKALGDATLPPCDDTGRGSGKREEIKQNAYKMKGVSPSVAIAVGDTPETSDLFAVFDGTKIPKAVRQLERKP